MRKNAATVILLVLASISFLAFAPDRSSTLKHARFNQTQEDGRSANQQNRSHSEKQTPNTDQSNSKERPRSEQNSGTNKKSATKKAGDDKDGDSSVKWTDVIVAVFTVVLAALAAAQFCAAWWQAVSTDKSVKVAAYAAKQAKASADAAMDAVAVAERNLIAAERPWVAVELAIEGDLTFNSTEGRLNVVFLLSNTGKTPANNVDIEAKIVPHTLMEFDEIKSKLNEISKRIAPKQSLIGFTLFPGEKTSVKHSLPIPLSEATAEAERREMKHLEDFLTPAVVGCVVYRSPFSKRYHQTPFIMNLYRRSVDNPNIGTGIGPSHGNVAHGDLLPTRSFACGPAD